MKRLILLAVFFLLNMTAASICFSQTVNPDELFVSAMELYTKGQYSKAKSQLQMIASMDSATSEMKLKAREIMDKCDKKLAVINEEAKKKLDLSTSSLSFAYTGGTAEIKVSANVAWSVYDRPEWCKIVEMSTSSKTVKLSCDPNPVTSPREADIYIGVPGNRKAVHIYQEAGMNTRGAAVFRTVPQNAYVEIDGGRLFGKSGQAFDIDAGTHTVTITKEGYETYNSTFVIKAGMTVDSKTFDINLVPKFGILVPHVTMEESEIIVKPDIWIDNTYIDLTNWGVYSAQRNFDSLEGVMYYNLYKGDNIPLLPKNYKVTLKADGYRDVVRYVDLRKNDTTHLDVQMELIAGYVHFENDGDADSAAVMVNGVCKGYVGEEIRLPVGRTLIEITKPGFRCPEGIKEIDITEDVCLYEKVKMVKAVPCRVSTTVGGETVTVDGEKLPYQIGGYEFTLLEGQHMMEITREGYWHIVKEFAVERTDTLKSFENLAMEEVHPLSITLDERGLDVKLTSKDRKNDTQDYGIDPQRTSSNKRSETLALNVPYGKYKVEVTRPNYPKSKRMAYKTTMNFKENKSKKKWQVWPSSYILGIGGDYNLLYNATPAYETGLSGMYGSAYIGQLRICKGLSTNIIKAAAFSNGDDTLFPAELPDELREQNKNLFAMSVVMLNGEFRIGGDICNYADVAAMVSYAWYPQMVTFLPLSHMSGHDIFVGVELSSFLPIFNVNVKVGLQNFIGNRNFYAPSATDRSVSKESFVIQPYNTTAFVVSVGFSLGGWDAKGKNLIRVF